MIPWFIPILDAIDPFDVAASLDFVWVAEFNNDHNQLQVRQFDKKGIPQKAYPEGAEGGGYGDGVGGDSSIYALI